MAWTTNPSINNQTSSAATLNNWRGNAEYLYNLLPSVNPPFSAFKEQANLTSTTNLWCFIHRHRYLHATVYAYGTVTPTGIRVFVNGTSIGTLSGSGDGPYTGIFDLAPRSLAVGSMYKTFVDFDFTGSGTGFVMALYESVQSS
jgi:hypothetical protein